MIRFLLIVAGFAQAIFMEGNMSAQSTNKCSTSNTNIIDVFSAAKKGPHIPIGVSAKEVSIEVDGRDDTLREEPIYGKADLLTRVQEATTSFLNLGGNQTVVVLGYKKVGSIYDRFLVLKVKGIEIARTQDKRPMAQLKKVGSDINSYLMSLDTDESKPPQKYNLRFEHSDVKTLQLVPIESSDDKVKP